MMEDPNSTDQLDSSILTSVSTHHETDPLISPPSHDAFHPRIPSPPLARMEEDFDLFHPHDLGKELPEGSPESPEEFTPSPSPDTIPIGDVSPENDLTIESRAFGDEPDAKFPHHAIPHGSGILITDEHNHQIYIPDVVNTYQQKKNLAQGMMDLALLSANANQLRYVLETFDRHPYNYVSLVLISCSLIFQVAVGIGLIMNSQYNVTKEEDIQKADRINNYTVIGIFLITVVNVFITSFGVAEIPTVRE